MLKKILGNQRGDMELMEITVWFGIIFIVSTMLFVIASMFYANTNSNNIAQKQSKNEVTTIETPVTDKVEINSISNGNNLLSEIEVEVIAGVIVSLLGFGASRLYSQFNYKRK